MTDSARAYAMTRATADVAGALLWLEDHGFTLTRSRGSEHEHFGNVFLVYERAGTRVHVVRDRGQWAMDVSPESGAEPTDYAVLVAAAEGRDYREYPGTPGALPEQLPQGISWLDTLPNVMAWLARGGRGNAIANAADQKYVKMWPESHKARDITRRWRREGRAEQPTDGDI